MKSILSRVAIAALLIVGAATTALATQHASRVASTPAHATAVHADKACPLGCTGHCPFGGSAASAAKATNASMVTVAMASAQKSGACAGVNPASCPKGCQKKA